MNLYAVVVICGMLKLLMAQVAVAGVAALLGQSYEWPPRNVRWVNGEMPVDTLFE